jgi:hypothetical protein
VYEAVVCVYVVRLPKDQGCFVKSAWASVHTRKRAAPLSSSFDGAVRGVLARLRDYREPSNNVVRCRHGQKQALTRRKGPFLHYRATSRLTKWFFFAPCELRVYGSRNVVQHRSTGHCRVPGYRWSNADESMRGKKRLLNDIVIDKHRLLSPPYAGHRVVHSNGFYVSAVAYSKAWVVGL